MSKPIDAVELSAQVNVMLRIKEAEDKILKENVLLEKIVSERTFELEESEKKYKALFENSPLPYQSLNVDGILIDVNRAWLKEFGYRRDEVINNSFADFLVPEFKNLLENTFTEFKNKGFIHDSKMQVRHNDGHVIDILVEGTIGYNPDGSFNRTYCVLQDITEKNKIEEALRTSEDRFRKAFQTSPDSVNINRLEDGKYVSVNHGFTQIMGYSDEDVIGKTSLELNIWVNPSDRKKLVEGLKKKGTFKNLEAKFRAKNGKIVDGLMSASLIDLEGIPHLINITRDITERKKIEEAHRESERKLNTLFNNLQGIAYRCKFDENWTMEFISAGFEGITGYSSDDVIGNRKMSFNDIIVPEDRDRVYREVEKALGKKEGFEIKYKIVTSKGELKYVLEKGVGVFSDDRKKVIALEGFITDITQQVLADKNLKENEQKLSLIINESPVGISITDLEGKFVDVNPALCKITGFTKEEMIGNHFNKFSHPDDSEINNKKFNNLIKGKIPFFELEKRYIHKKGNNVYVHIRSQLIHDQEGNPIFQTAVIEDITQRKRSEWVQRSLFNISNAVVRESVDLNDLIDLIRKELGAIIDTTNFYVARLNFKRFIYIFPLSIWF